MSFRLVSNSVTLDDLERRNSPNRSVISPNSVALGVDYVKVVEDTPVLWYLPSTLRVSTTTLGQFQSGVKTLLFRLAYGT